MNKFTVRLIVILLTFIFGITITFLLVKINLFDIKKERPESVQNYLPDKNSDGNLPVVSYCELANNPEKYDEKIVRLKETLHIGDEGHYFYDSGCDDPDKGSIVRSNKEIWSIIEKARSHKGKDVLSRDLELIVIGKFENKVFKDCCVITPFQFEILQIEKVTAKE